MSRAPGFAQAMSFRKPFKKWCKAEWAAGRAPHIDDSRRAFEAGYAVGVLRGREAAAMPQSFHAPEGWNLVPVEPTSESQGERL